MLNSRKYAVLTAMLSAAGLLPMSAMANISFTEGGERLINTLHTHLYSPSSGLSSSDEIKLAAVCFISDTAACNGAEFGGNGDSDFDLNDQDRCYKEGYTVSACPDGYILGGKKCPYGPYYTDCVATCPSGYKTCEPPYYGVGEACDGKYASCEEDTERACKELDSEFTDTCQSGWKVDPNNTCEYDATFGKCCNLCEGYDYTTIPEGYIADGAACMDCNGTSKYKIKINPCEGFQDCGVMGGEAGAATCMSGSQIKYDNCKPCPNLGTLTSCPSPFTCTYEECSNRYYKSGCLSGYDWNASAQTCTQQCASSYQYTCTGTNQTGGSGTACNGKYTSCTCSSPYTWSNGTCSCPTTYQYTCIGTGYAGGAGTACGGKYTSCTCASGYKWENGSCVKPRVEFGQCNGNGANCSLGDIVFSDGTCSANTISGKTPIAVVVYKSGNCGQAMALESIGKYLWTTEFIDISALTNYTSESAASTDFASCENSEIIRLQGDSNAYPAAWAAYNYTTTGTKVGDWCLPAAGIFASIYNNQFIINTGFVRAGGQEFTTSNTGWSSTEHDIKFAWSSDMSNYGLNNLYIKNTHSLPVNPVLEF